MASARSSSLNLDVGGVHALRLSLKPLACLRNPGRMPVSGSLSASARSSSLNHDVGRIHALRWSLKPARLPTQSWSKADEGLHPPGVCEPNAGPNVGHAHQEPKARSAELPHRRSNRRPGHRHRRWKCEIPLPLPRERAFELLGRNRSHEWSSQLIGAEGEAGYAATRRRSTRVGDVGCRTDDKRRPP